MGKEKYRHFFEENVMDFYGYLVKYITTITDDRVLAVDIVQDTMLTAWQKIEIVYRYEYLKPALRTMAENRLKNYHKSQKNALKEVPLELGGEGFLEEEQEDLLVDILRKEDSAELLHLVNQLRSDHARIILLHYYYDISLQQVAQNMDVSYNTVLSWHRRALKRLGELVLSQGETPLGEEWIS